MNTRNLIREALESDIPSLCLLMEELSGSSLSADDMRGRLSLIRQSQSDRLYVYEQDSVVLGTLVFRIRENIREVSRYGEIGIIVVRSEYKRLGIGKKLMDFAEQLARQYGCKGTYLISGFGRAEEAHRFYTALGYEITGYRFVKPFDKENCDDTLVI